MINVYLVRRSRETVVTDAKGNAGYLGTMHVNGVTYDTIERAQGYVRLPVGSYPLQMFNSPKLGHVLRPLSEEGGDLAGKRSLIRIHAGANPSDVEGCIAPGFRSPTPDGLPLTGSREALAAILDACGEWEAGKIVGTLFVRTDYMSPNEKDCLGAHGSPRWQNGFLPGM